MSEVSTGHLKNAPTLTLPRICGGGDGGFIGFFQFCAALTAIGVLLCGCHVSTDTMPDTQIKMPPLSTNARDNRVPGEWLVKVTPGVTLEQLCERYRVLGLIEIKPISPNLYWLKFPLRSDPSAAALQEAGGLAVEFVQPNFRYRAYE